MYMFYLWVVINFKNDCLGVYYLDGQLCWIIVENVVYDINVGIIWNDVDVRVKCFKVCKDDNVKWIGNWKIIV